MLDMITANLHRQEKGLKLLLSLLEEEFACLTGRDPKAVTGCEFSIQELLRQLGVERIDLKRMVTAVAPESGNLRGLEAQLPPDEAVRFRTKLKEMDAQEQKCAIQAEKNSRLAFALAEQSKGLLEFMHKQVMPKNENTYARNGRYQGHRPEASILRGRS